MKRQLEEESEDENNPTKRIKMAPRIDYCALRDKGKKAYLEDRVLCIPDLSHLDEALSGGRYSIFAVFDGHGGSYVANTLMKLFPRKLIEHLKPNLPHTIKDKKQRNVVAKQALIKTFLLCDEEILANQEKFAISDGATATVCFIDNNTLWTGNLGDTRAVIGVNKGGKIKAACLTKDHVASQKDEQARIINDGGIVQNLRVSGILEVSRSFGDPLFKGRGVISTPYVSKVSFTEKISFALIATDGLWSVWKSMEAVQYCHDKLHHPTKPSLQEMTKMLLNETIIDRHCTDNCAVLIFRLNPDFKEGQEKEAVKEVAEN